MEKLTTIKWIICRICLKSSTEEMLKIYAKDGDNIEENLVDKIQLCGGIRLSDSDNLPDSICSKCLILLKVANKFRSLCQKSQQHLAEILHLSIPHLKATNETDAFAVNLKKPETNIISDLTLKQELESIHEEENSNEMQFIMELDGNVEHIETDVDVEETIEEVDSEYVEYQDLSQNEDIEYLQDGIHDLVTEEDSNTLSESAENEILIQPPEGFIMLTEEENKEKVRTQRDKRKNEKNPQIDNSYKIVQKFTNPEKPERKRRTKATSNTKVKRKVDEDANTSFICFQCGNIYAERSKLTLHLKVHNKEKPHECEICHKRFAQTPQLSRHMNSHTGSRPFKCKFCPSSFADPSTCIKHERIHTNERPYVCDICGKAFSYSNVLKVHMMMHTGEKPYSCEHCGKKFAQLHHKKSHERTHNTQIVLKQEEEESDDTFDH